jgi:hypothetical protein
VGYILFGADFAIAEPYETWPILLEKAYGQILGKRERLQDGGDAHFVWRQLLGTHSVNHNREFDKMTDNQIDTLIRGAISNQRLVVLSSHPDVSGKGGAIFAGPVTNPTIHHGHAYVVTGITHPDFVQLYNPWGKDHAQFPLSRIREFFYRVQID